MLDTPQEEHDFGVTDNEVEDLYNKFGSDEVDGPSVAADAEEETPLETSATPKAEETEAKAPAPERIKAEAPPELEYEFTHNGKPIKAPLSKILKWAQQGYDYPQRVAELNKQRETIHALEQQYRPIDEWVQNNQDKWDKLQAVIKAEQEGTVDLPPQVVEKLNKYDQYFKQLEERELQAKVQAEDQALDQEIKSIQDKYKDLDWVSIDDSGRTREQKVLAHAAEQGFKTFKSAFLDLYHEDLLNLRETKAKEELAAKKERDSKQGLLAKQAPKTVQRSKQSNGKAYPDTADILEEFGINS
jgi:hypothetical protein